MAQMQFDDDQAFALPSLDDDTAAATLTTIAVSTRPRPHLVGQIGLPSSFRRAKRELPPSDDSNFTVSVQPPPKKPKIDETLMQQQYQQPQPQQQAQPTLHASHMAEQEAEHIDVLSAGEIMRAPLPMHQVLELEQVSGAAQGEYFIELMRRRLAGLLTVQEKWISRLCNQKHAKHVNTQLEIRDFMKAVLESYSKTFGEAKNATVAPIRRRAKSATQQQTTM